MATARRGTARGSASSATSFARFKYIFRFSIDGYRAYTKGNHESPRGNYVLVLPRGERMICGCRVKERKSGWFVNVAE